MFDIFVSKMIVHTFRVHSHLLELCDQLISVYYHLLEQCFSDWVNWRLAHLAACVSLHYWMAGSAGWLVDWVMIEHTACQPLWLLNWLTNWLPARLNDDLTFNLPLFQCTRRPSTQCKQHNGSLTALGGPLHGEIITQTNNMTIRPPCNAPLAGHSPCGTEVVALTKRSISYND